MSLKSEAYLELMGRAQPCCIFVAPMFDEDAEADDAKSDGLWHVYFLKLVDPLDSGHDFGLVKVGITKGKALLKRASVIYRRAIHTRFVLLRGFGLQSRESLSDGSIAPRTSPTSNGCALPAIKLNRWLRRHRLRTNDSVISLKRKHAGTVSFQTVRNVHLPQMRFKSITMLAVFRKTTIQRSIGCSSPGFACMLKPEVSDASPASCRTRSTRRHENSARGLPENDLSSL